MVMHNSTQKGQHKAASQLILTLLLTAGLGGCLATKSPQTPPIYQKLNRSHVSVEPQTALGLINSYRQNKGLNALKLDPRLNAAAKEQAEAMAKAGKVRHSLSPAQTLPKRLARAGYDYERSAENISAGYWTLAEAFSGWRDSPRHNKNMLTQDVTDFGIATAYRPGAKYQVFWAMVVAKPEQTTPKQTTEPANSVIKLMGQ